MVDANYFDGRSTRVHAVSLSVVEGDLIINGDIIDLRVRFADVKVDERLGRAARRLRLKDGSFCEVADLVALDALLASTAHRDGRIDRMQRHPQLVLLACVACVLCGLVTYKWGLPWAAAQGAHHLPPAIGKKLSGQTLKILDGGILVPSKIPDERQRALSTEFHALRLPGGEIPDSALLFRGSPQLEANAFTLPDGTIIVLDDLITSIGDDQQVLAVLAHELGHVHGRHGLQLLLQSSVIGGFLTFYIGDISYLLAAAPAVLAQARYSQDLEQQADDYGAALLMQNRMSPGLLADALEKVAKCEPRSPQDGYLLSHPATAERMRHLRLLASSFAGEQRSGAEGGSCVR